MDHLSTSQINVYLLCGLKYKYQYIDKRPKPFKSSALAFGSALHSTLAWFHEKRLNGKDVTLEKLSTIFDADWYSQKLETEIRFKEREQDMSLVATAKEFLRLYFENNHINVKAYELFFRVPLVNHVTGEDLGIVFEGYMDLVEEEDTIVEFKTSAQRMNENDVHHHLQLTAYSYAYQMLYRKLPKSLKIVNFIKGKNPRMSTIPTTRTAHQFKGFLYLASSVLKGIQSGIFIPHRGYWCNDCEYADICPLQKYARNAALQSQKEYVA